MANNQSVKSEAQEVNVSDVSQNCEGDVKVNCDKSQPGVVAAEVKTTISDLPWTPDQEDLLGMEPFRNAIIEYIRKSDTPFNIALQGEGGCGKTSIMKSVKAALCDCENSQLYCVWVDAWKFTVVDSAFKVAIDILKMMIDQIKTLSPTHDRYKQAIESVERIASVLNIVIDTTDDAEDEGIKNLIGRIAKAAKAAWGILRNKPVDKAALIEQLKVEINKLINVVVETNQEYACSQVDGGNDKNSLSYKKSFLFFIDHLDRISPSLVLEILDILKNLFDFKHCVFIVAFDRSNIAQGLESKVGKMNVENAQNYMHFLDDKFQVVIPINTEYNDTMLFVEKMLYSYLFDSGELSEVEVNELDSVVRVSVGTNPRNLKKLINKLSLLRVLSCNTNQYGVDRIDQILASNMSKKDIKKIKFILCCIQVSTPEIYNLIEVRPYFRGWDKCFVYQMISPFVSGDELSHVMSLRIVDIAGNVAQLEQWEDSLFRICFPFNYLRHNYDKTRSLFRKMDEIFKNARPNGDYYDLISVMFGFYDMDSGVHKSLKSVLQTRPGEKTI